MEKDRSYSPSSNLAIAKFDLLEDMSTYTAQEIRGANFAPRDFIVNATIRALVHSGMIKPHALRGPLERSRRENADILGVHATSVDRLARMGLVEPAAPIEITRFLSEDVDRIYYELYGHPETETSSGDQAT
jgi:hypothetical protein